MDEPVWISRELAEAVHYQQLQEHGGRFGLRDANLLESALARPRQRWAYEGGVDLADLSASYAYGIAKNPPFVDGNKRTAFTTLGVFLLTNGVLLDAPEPEAVEVMLGVAAGELGEPELAAWGRQRGTTVSA